MTSGDVFSFGGDVLEIIRLEVAGLVEGEVRERRNRISSILDRANAVSWTVEEILGIIGSAVL